MQTFTCGPSCPPGTVGIGRVCQNCTDNCLTCSGTTSYCGSCKTGFFLYNSTSKSCVNPCPTGLFMDISSGYCTGCLPPCQTCGSYSNECLSCSSTLLLQGTVCQSSCNVGYYAYAGKCVGCPLSCSACTSSLTCTACATNNYLYISACVSQCPPTFPVIKVNGSCAACSDSSCVICDYLDRCTNCTYPKLLLSGTCVISCPQYYSVVNGTICVYNNT